MGALAAPTAQGVTQQIRISEPEKLPVEFIKEPEQKVPLEPMFVTTHSADSKRPRPAYPVQTYPDKY
ncbi:hypothetical protein B9Z55_022000 [Caenorhabditis nigoni]|nr:hypothetical protein B9Z55_022000 [Caenorhabditis nigoni]